MPRVPAKSILRPGKYSAAASAAVRANAVSDTLSSPLIAKTARFTDDLSSDEDSSLGSLSSVKSGDVATDSMSGTDIMKTITVSLLATAGVAASAAAMVAIPSAVVLVMGGFCIVNAPTVVKKQFSIAKSAGMRTSIMSVRKEINLLKEEIDFLDDTVDDLQAEADVLVGLENDLRNIATKQGTNVTKLVELVNENEEILSEMQSNLRKMFVSAMAKIIMRSDHDGDMKIDTKEVPFLALRLQIQLEQYGMKLDTSKFDAMVQEDNDISNVMKFCGELLFPSDNENSDDSVDSEVTFDFEEYCRSLDENEEVAMTHEEKASMATIDDRFSKGSVDVARGKRMTLMPNVNKKESRRKTIMKEVKKRQTVMKKARRSLVSNANKPDAGGPRGSFLGINVYTSSMAEC